MPRVRLIHWKAAEAAPLLAALRQAGHDVDYEEQPDYHLSQAIRAQLPAAVVIDLSRLPSHGREIAAYLRGSKATRHVPIVFVNGLPEKIEATRRVLPDAVYTTAARLPQALRRAIARAPAAPVVPAQMMERYRGRTAAQKLGIKPGCRVALIDPPRDYAAVLGDLPPGASLEEHPDAPCPVTLWFVRDPVQFQSALPRMRDRAAASRLWILWQKQTPRQTSPLKEQFIRDRSLAVGLVDYKVCAVDSTWSALAFARKTAR